MDIDVAEWTMWDIFDISETIDVSSYIGFNISTIIGCNKCRRFDIYNIQCQSQTHTTLP